MARFKFPLPASRSAGTLLQCEPMALIRLGGVVAEISGSLDGVTFSHNRNGRYARARVKPTNPRSVKQQSVRSQLATISSQWRGLSSAARASWSALGATITDTNRLGDATTLTGLQAFVSINQLRLTAGQSITTTAPIIDAIPTFVAGAVVSTVATGGTLTIATTTLPTTGQTLRVYATGAVSQGRNFFRKSQYKLLATFSSSAVSPLDIKTPWSAAYGSIGTGIVGGKISIWVVPVSVNGFAGPPVRVDTIWS